MDLKQIEKLMAAMARTGTKKLSFKEEGWELQLERGDEGFDRSLLLSQLEIETPTPQRQIAPLAAGHVHKPLENSSSDESKEESKGIYVTSPMVGTFYASPSPDDSPFVKVGDRVEEGTVVCIIEAMKVMNEVRAGLKGSVAEILIKSGDPVEFGSKILRIV